MKHLDFFNAIKENNIATSYLFCGEEEYVKESALSALTSAITSEDTLDFNRTMLDENAGLDSCIAACETYPIMSAKRLVIWTNPKLFLQEWSKSDGEKLEHFFSSIPETTCLVLYYKGELDKRKKGYKFLISHTTLVDFAPLDEFEAIRWVMSTAKKAGKNISQQDANTLVQMVGTGVLDLQNELQKLIHKAGESAAITSGDFSVVKSTNIDYNVFAMITKFLRGNPAEGMKMYYSLIEAGENNFMILGALASKFRNLYTAKSLLESGMNRNLVIKEMGGTFGAKQAAKECESLTWQQIKQAVDAFEQADFNIKNGVMPEHAAVEFAIASAFQKR